MKESIKIKTLASEVEQQRRLEAAAAFRSCPIPDSEVLASSGLFLKRQELTKLLFFNQIYLDHILNIHGVIMEFGVRWGPNLVSLNNLRGIYEPFNHNRKLIGFDTFKGFPSVDVKDGTGTAVEKGGFSVTEGYKSYLERILTFHEQECPLNHISKNRLVEGDASIKLQQYLEENPETIVAFAWFDFDLYEPTKRCLEQLRPHLVKGSVVGFDELNDPGFPGETKALDEVFGLNNIRLERNRYSGMQSYFVVS